MAKKKKDTAEELTARDQIAEVRDQPITETIETNFMPYAMSVIISRAIPEIDGFKPSHRKLLYTMYKMGLMSGERVKSANIVGRTMQLNPHSGDSIYETLVRLTRDNETLLHPFIDSKGSFGKHYSADPPSAQRYTEARLEKFCETIFDGIERDAVDMIPNYDGTQTEPLLLPTAFPNILVNPNIGVAVGMNSTICSFNLSEVCEATIQLLKNPNTSTDRLLEIMPAPDFSTGGFLLYDKEEMRALYETGRGPVRLRSRYSYDKAEGCIEVTQIPYTTTIHIIIKQITQLVKEGKLKEITDVRDEIGLSGFKLTIDVKRGTDPDKLMAKLFRLTSLQDTESYNFIILVNSAPLSLGVADILKEWITFRMGCVRRALTFDLKKKEEKLHLLLGLGKILLDIDKAIKIIRGTPLEKDVIPNLMTGFDIDRIQAEYIADIKLRNLNKEYIINRIKEIEDLRKEIEDLKDTIGSDLKLKGVIAKELKDIKAKYGLPRKTQIIDAGSVEEYSEEDDTENFNCKYVLTKEGYFKKITLVSLRGSDEQKFKEGDSIREMYEGDNRMELLFFSDRAQVYKAKSADFDTCKAGALGDYIPAKLGFDEGEKVIALACFPEFTDKENMVFFFENGKAVRIPLTAYETKAARRKLTGAYSDSSPIVGAFYEKEPMQVCLLSDEDKGILIDTSVIPVKENRAVGGLSVFSLSKGKKVVEACMPDPERFPKIEKLKKNKIPATGIKLSAAK